MKYKRRYLIATLICIFISACGSDAPDSVVNETAVNGIYTQVAMTLSAQAPAATNTTIATFTAFPTTSKVSLGITTSIPSPVSISYNGNSSAVGCDNSSYLSDVTIPDGTVLAPGATFTKTWSLQNTGSCEWTTSYSIVFYSGNAMSGTTTALTEAVSVSSSGKVSVELTAPSTAGSYTGYWRLQNASGTSFGEPVYVQIVVSGSTSTSTATSTSEEEEGATSTPTSTTAPTETSSPTETPVPTETLSS
ncbi:MAG: NBR1-Ig-like domain-containing protein [Anaerolineales bacterium]